MAHESSGTRHAPPARVTVTATSAAVAAEVRLARAPVASMASTFTVNELEPATTVEGWGGGGAEHGAAGLGGQHLRVLK